RHNLRQLAQIVAPGRLLAVVKAEAYGHGLLAVARAAQDVGVWGLGVVNVDEALALRGAGIPGPILVLGPVFPFELKAALTAGVTLPVYGVEIARAVSQEATRLGTVAKVHLKVDTGLGRLAVPCGEARPFLEEVRRLPGLDIEGLYSHLADAE